MALNRDERLMLITDILERFAVLFIAKSLK